MGDSGGGSPDQLIATEGQCSNCQARWSGNARFCSNCGSPLVRPGGDISGHPTADPQQLPGALPEVSTPRPYATGGMPVGYPTMSASHTLSIPGYPPHMGPVHMDPNSPHVGGMMPGGGLVVTGVPAGQDPWFQRWHSINTGSGGGTTYVVELRNGGGAASEIYDNPTCARIGCLFSWIPIVGFITFCVNYHAPEGSMQRRLARTALATSIASLTFLIVMQLFVAPQQGDQGSRRTNP